MAVEMVSDPSLHELEVFNLEVVVILVSTEAHVHVGGSGNVSACDHRGPLHPIGVCRELNVLVRNQLPAVDLEVGWKTHRSHRYKLRLAARGTVILATYLQSRSAGHRLIGCARRCDDRVFENDTLIEFHLAVCDDRHLVKERLKNHPLSA